MNFDEMTVEEIIEYFSDKKRSGDIITLSELDTAVNATSVVDPVANPKALTILYSGGEDKVASALAQSDNSDIRIIDRTDRANEIALKMFANANVLCYYIR